MHTRNFLLVSLLAALYGCQPEAPKQEAAAPAPAPAPTQQAAPAATENAAQPAAETESAQVEPAQSADAPVAASEANEPAAEPKPIEKSEPAMPEAEIMALAKKSNCLACHAIDKKLVGPAWKDVAAKYRGDAGAEAMLMDKIAKGSKGVWGPMAMPAQPMVSEADRRILAKFVLSLK